MVPQVYNISAYVAKPCASYFFPLIVYVQVDSFEMGKGT